MIAGLVATRLDPAVSATGLLARTRRVDVGSSNYLTALPVLAIATVPALVIDAFAVERSVDGPCGRSCSTCGSERESAGLGRRAERLEDEVEAEFERVAEVITGLEHVLDGEGDEVRVGLGVEIGGDVPGHLDEFALRL